MSESTMRYDPENDIFFHKHEDGSWSADSVNATSH